MSRRPTVLLLSLVLLEIGRGTVVVAAASDDRDHAVDWVLGGLQEGSRPLRPGAGGASATAGQKTSRAAVGASDTGGRTSRSDHGGAPVTRERGVSGNRGIVSSGAAQPVSSGTGSARGTTGTGSTGSGSSKEGTSETRAGGSGSIGGSGTISEGAGNVATGSGGLGEQHNTGTGTTAPTAKTSSGGIISGGGQTTIETPSGGGSVGGTGTVSEGTSGTPIEGGSTVESNAETGTTEPAPATSSGGTTSNDQLGIHVEADTSGGDATGGVTVTGTDTDLSAGTEVETGVETGVEASGTVDATADITDPATTVTSEATVADTGVTAELSGTTDVGDIDLITDDADLSASDDCTGDPLHPCPPTL